MFWFAGVIVGKDHDRSTLRLIERYLDRWDEFIRTGQTTGEHVVSPTCARPPPQGQNVPHIKTLFIVLPFNLHARHRPTGFGSYWSQVSIDPFRPVFLSLHHHCNRIHM